MHWKGHIVATADTCFGKPRIERTRITVELVLSYVAAGKTEADIFETYPHLTVEQIRAAVAFACNRVGSEATLSGVEAPAWFKNGEFATIHQLDKDFTRP